MFRSAVNWDITVTPRIGYASDRAPIHEGRSASPSSEYSHNQNATISDPDPRWLTVGAGLNMP